MNTLSYLAIAIVIFLVMVVAFTDGFFSLVLFTTLLSLFVWASNHVSKAVIQGGKRA